MSAWLPELLRSQWLWLLPLAALVLYWQHRQPTRLGHWQSLLAPAFQHTLLSASKQRFNRTRSLWLGSAWLLAIAALAGPSWQQYQLPARQSLSPLVIMLELTPEMLAQDGRPTRLQQAKHKILDLLESRQGAPTAVVVFAGSAHTLVPLSEDQATLKHLLEALDPSIMPLAGHRADLALHQAQALLAQAAYGRGELLLMTTQLPAASLSALQQQTASLARPLRILGVGSVAGAPLLDEQGGFIRTPQGAIMVAKLEQSALQRFAQSNGFFYQTISVDDTDLSKLQLQKPVASAAGEAQLPVKRWLDQGYWLLLPLLLLSALAARRGVLLAAALLLLPTEPSWAMSWQDLWLRADQQGAKALAQERPEAAASHFKDPLWRGYALFKAGDFMRAAEQFAHHDSALAHYNRGTALAAANELDAALEAFNQALAREPELIVAEQNRALVTQALDEQKKAALAEAAQAGPSLGLEQPDTADADASQTAPTRDAGSAQETSHAPELAERDEESAQSLTQWLRQVPDHPGELLKRKFLLELPQEPQP